MSNEIYINLLSIFSLIFGHDFSSLFHRKITVNRVDTNKSRIVNNNKKKSNYKIDKILLSHRKSFLYCLVTERNDATASIAMRRHVRKNYSFCGGFEGPVNVTRSHNNAYINWIVANAAMTDRTPSDINSSAQSDWNIWKNNAFAFKRHEQEHWTAIAIFSLDLVRMPNAKWLQWIYLFFSRAASFCRHKMNKWIDATLANPI